MPNEVQEVLGRADRAIIKQAELIRQVAAGVSAGRATVAPASVRDSIGRRNPEPAHRTSQEPPQAG